MDNLLGRTVKHIYRADMLAAKPVVMLVMEGNYVDIWWMFCICACMCVHHPPAYMEFRNFFVADIDYCISFSIYSGISLSE